jgi:hypothetical protein
MPSAHSSTADIPHIAIVTGSVDSVECVFRKIGIADSEFTDPTGNGRINFYLGIGGTAGTQYSVNTPNEDQLWGTQAALNAYDLVMFPCQGSPYTQTSASQANMVNYADAGGRIFATHYSYAWLYNNTILPPGASGTFKSTATWEVDPTDSNTFADDPGTGIINQNFEEGLHLAQWLTVLYPATTPGQIAISTLRHDFLAVTPQTSNLWISDNDFSLGTVPMQYTFNAPVGVSAVNQCGRVLFNDYHVEDAENDPTNGTFFPNECNTDPMTPQEKMLEFQLFDLTSPVQVSNPPTASISFANAPTTFTQGDTADTITIDVTNTSTTTATNSTLTASVFSVPAGLTPASLAGVGGGTGWNCSVSTLTCTRSTALAANTSDSILLTVSVASNATIGTGSAVGASVSGGALASSVSNDDPITIAASLIAQTINFTQVTGAHSVGQQVNLTATASSGLPVKFVTTTSSVCTVSGTTASLIAGGSCDIEAQQWGNSTYAVAPFAFTIFWVNHAAQTISFPAIAFSQTADTTLPLSATATSGLPVTFASLTPATCTVSGTTLNLNSYGDCTIQASQAGNNIYNEAGHVSQTVFIHHLTQTVNFGPIATQTVGTPLTLSATASTSLPVIFASFTPAVCTVSGDTATFLEAGTCTIEATQVGNGVYGAVNAKQSFKVTAVPVT